MEKKSILFVNEDTDGVSMYSELLSRIGYTVYKVTGAEHALKAAIELAPDVIIADLLERTDGGWKTPELLKDHERARRIPLIVLTGWAQPEDRARAEASGCDLFLAKPVTPSELAEHIAGVLTA